MIKNKKQFLNESNKVNCHPGGFSDGNFQITKECHPEERSELRFLPVIDDSQERWSDSEHTRLVDESHAGRFRMTKNTEGRGEAKEFTLNILPLPLGEGWGEGKHWQKTLQTATLSLALSFFIAAPVCAADTPPVPTLDRVKAENKNFINSSHPTYTLTELTADETATEGSITVKIGDKTYYYTPNEGDNTNTLQLLSATGNAALVETTQDDALYIADGKYYKYEAEKLPDSAYTLTETTVSDPENLPDNVITLYDKTEVIKYYDPTTGEEVAEADRQEGVEYKEVTTIETTPKYYTVSLKQTEYGDKNAASAKPVYFKWIDVDGKKSLTQIGATENDHDIEYYMQTEYGDSSGDETLTYGWEESADGELEFKLNPATPVGQQIFYKYSELSFNEIKTETKDLGTTTNPSGTEDSPTQIIGGAAVNNPSGSNVSIDNILYKDNVITANVTKTSGTSYTYANIQGGAVYNKGTISKITGAFINNELNVTSDNTTTEDLYSYANGGAIANLGQIGDGTDGSVAIDADFIGNHVVNTATGSYNNIYAQGGAIYNYANSSSATATIGSITGDFIGNYAAGKYANGGAIYNYNGTIGDVTGDFIGNYASSAAAAASSGYGGAIYNYNGTIGDVRGDFIGNYASAYRSANGGAIYNYNGTIGDVTGDFIGNYASDEYTFGGAIYNYANSTSTATIGSITGDFIGNYASGSSRASGGAIYNNAGTIKSITGDFIGNYASSSSGIYAYASGGAVYNTYGTIASITGDFIGNYASSSSSSSSASGGAIYNYGSIESITGDFIGNYASSTASSAYGGAIYNSRGTIGDITGDFIGNYASAYRSANGGAIYNDASGTNAVATIGSITGDFIGNYAASSASYSAQGGAIYNYGYDGGTATIGSITGDFIGNYASASSSGSYAYTDGGAIYNGDGTIGSITGDFIGNYTSSSSSSYAEGGAIYNSGSNASIGNITGNFIDNYASSTNSGAEGGAIHNNAGTIKSITGDFIGNYASGEYAYGGAIYNYAISSGATATIGSITGDFIGNYAVSSDDVAYGGAIYNYGGNRGKARIGSITGDFIGNYTSSSSGYGGAIYNYAAGSRNTATIDSITGDFIGNYVEAEYTGTSSTSNNRALGGAIYNCISSSSGKATIGLTNNNFLNNYAKVTTAAGNAYAKGGAIFTNYDLTLNADNGTSLISGNYTETNGIKDQNAIYVANLANSSGTIQRNTTFTLNAVNNGKIQIDDKIAGGSYYESSSKFWETSDHAYTLALTGDSTGTISLYNDVKNANVTSNNVTVDFANGETRDYDFVSMTAGENTNLNLDVDFTNKTADTITTQNNSTGTLIINAINTLGTTDGAVTVQIIKNTDPSSSLQLALGDNITEVTEEFVFDKNYVEHKDKFIQEGGLSLATTDTTNDSITVIQEKIYDTLQLINSYQTDEERTFQFADSSKYTLSEDLNPTTAGVLNINGVSASAPSTLDANTHTLFNLQNETTLNIKNTTIENAKDFAIKAEHENAVVNLTNVSVKGTTTDTPDINKAAIQSKVDLNITADAGKSEFSGNTAAIYLDNADKTVSMNSVNSGEIVLEDVVDGQAGYSVEFKGDNKSKITVNNNINNANISLDSTNLYVGKENVFDNSVSLSLNSGTMYLNNNVIGTMHVPTLNLNGNTDLYVDVDLANEQMDRVTADTYNVADDAILNIKDLNLISTTEKENVKILFADEPLANNVAYSGDSPVSYKGINVIYSPIYKYTVNYGVDENDKQGYFFFNKATAGIGDGSGSDIGGGAAGNISDSFNPSILAPAVATQAGAYTTRIQRSFKPSTTPSSMLIRL